MSATSAIMTDKQYALLTAAYNEEQYIETTIQSVLRQCVRPHIWVIVSDGSTDRTDEIVQQYAATHPFIHFVRREKDGSRGFASKVFALRAGLQMLTLDRFHFIGHLDADIELPPCYYRDLLMRFEEDPELGIAGGWYFEKTRNGMWISRPGNSKSSIPDGIQMLRCECYKEIGDLVPIEYGGEDWYAQIRARMCGWRVRAFPELQARHLRASGTRGSFLRYCYRAGFMDYAVGSHPLFEVLKMVKMSATPPYLLNSLVRFSGFLVAYLSEERMVSAECVAFLQKEQLGRLRSLLVSLRRGHLSLDA